MSQTFDLSQFPSLPSEVVKAFVAQQAALELARYEASVERAARQHEQAVVAGKETFIAELKALIEKLEGQISAYRKTKFGPKSAKVEPGSAGAGARRPGNGDCGHAGADRCCRGKDRGPRPQSSAPHAPPASPAPCPKACRA